MAGRKRSHSESRWPLLPPTVIRCNATRLNGSRCKREAEAGSVVCDQHGAAAPQIRRRAAERLIMTGDEAVELLIKWMHDEDVPYGVRAKIAQDIADRAGLAATQVHQIVPSTEDPVMRFFEDAFSNPRNWEQNPPQPAIEERVIDRDGEPEEIVEAEIIEAEGEPAHDTPTRIAEMIKAGAFDREPGQ
jgi:hypothetical protein